MRESTRNIAIGLTVLVALALLAAMILVFAGLPGPLQSGYDIKLHFPGSGGAHEGDPVHLNGMQVGKIIDIYFTDNDARKGVTMVVRIDEDTRIPGNVQACILSKGLAGGAYLDLTSDGPDRIDPDTGGPLEFLPKDYGKPIEGTLRPGLPIPKKLTDAMAAVSALAKNLNIMVGKPTDSPQTRPSLFAAMGTLNRVLLGFERVFADVKTEKDMKAILANLAEATALASKAVKAFEAFGVEAKEAAKQAKKTFEGATTMVAVTRKQIDRLAGKLVEDAEKVSVLLTTLNRVAMKVESGKGSAGLFLNDPKLYNSLLETTRQIDQLFREFRELVKVWKESGLGVKLK